MPTGFEIGNFTIRYYGIILMIGAVAAAFLAEREARRRQLNSEMVWDGLIWVLIGGIIGARLWHIFTPPPSMQAQGFTTMFYLTHPLDLINTRAGGLGIPGAILGGVIALILFCKRRKQNTLIWLDIAAPALALGQAIGRLGNYVNQELYGKPTDLPWAITIDPIYRLPGYREFEKFHPLFAYEAIWSLVNLSVLLLLSRRYSESLKPGDIFLTYLIIYPTGRFFLEFLRLDAPQLGTLNINQMIMGLVALTAAVILFWRHLRKPEESDLEQANSEIN